MDKPLVSIIIPYLALNDYILNENLPTLDVLSYRNFEVLLLPNKRTPQDDQLEKKYPWLKVIPTGKVTRPAEKRDIGAGKAKGSVLAFIDDDAYPTRDWLTHAVSLFDKKNVEAVCGPGILPPHVNFWEKVFDEILKTWIGSGGLGYRFTPKKSRYIDDYPSMNFLIQKDVFKSLGGFNSDYWPGEDSKLCEELVYNHKGKIWYSPHVVIYHHRRNTLIPFLKQHGQYGYHRGAFLAHGDKNTSQLFYLGPTGFIIYLLLLPYVAHNRYFFFPLALYIVHLVWVFVNALRNTKNVGVALVSPLVLFLMHVIYGIQFVRGYCTALVKKEKIY